MKKILIFLALFPINTLFGQQNPCNCSKYENTNSTLRKRAEIRFSGYINGKEVSKDTIFKDWNDQAKCDAIKSISFSGFDTLPKEFGRFRNVEKLQIFGNFFTTFIGLNLDYFPKLKELVIEESDLIISDSTKWLTQIEKLTTNKTDRKSTRLNSSHSIASRMPSSA